MAEDSGPPHYLLLFPAFLVFLFSAIILVSFLSTRQTNTIFKTTREKARMSSSEVEIRQMPANAIPQAEKIKIWLLSEDADFQIVEGIRICKNVEGLAEATWRLGKSFLDEIKRDLPDNQDKPSENSVIALHFEKPTIVPCEPGWKIEFIPVYTVKGPVKVAGREVSPNSYAHLTEEERVTGDFYAILLMFKP